VLKERLLISLFFAEPSPVHFAHAIEYIPDSRNAFEVRRAECDVEWKENDMVDLVQEELPTISYRNNKHTADPAL
jgi:hypothetical protein